MIKFVVEISNKAEGDFIIQLGEDNGYKREFDTFRGSSKPGELTYISFNTLGSKLMAYNLEDKLYNDMGVKIIPFSKMGKIKKLITENFSKFKVDDWVVCIKKVSVPLNISGLGYQEGLCFQITEVKSTLSDNSCYMGGMGSHGVYQDYVRKATQEDVNNTVEKVGKYMPSIYSDRVKIGCRTFHKDLWKAMTAVSYNAHGNNTSTTFNADGSVTIDGITCSEKNLRTIYNKLNGNG